MPTLRELDAAGRPRPPATVPGYLARRPPRTKGLRYPADPPRVEEIIAVMRAAGEHAHGDRVRGLVVVLWRAGPRIQGARSVRKPGSTAPLLLPVVEQQRSNEGSSLTRDL